MNLQLHTERLQIKPIALDDAAFMLELVNTSGWLRFIGDRNVKDLEGARNYIEGLRANPTIFYHSASLKDTQERVGVVTLLKRESEDHPDIGFAFLPDYQGKGLAYEASSAFLNELMQNRPAQSFLAITLTDNHSSIRLLKKLGMQFLYTKKRGSEDLTYFSI